MSKILLKPALMAVMLASASSFALVGAVVIDAETSVAEAKNENSQGRGGGRDRDRDSASSSSDSGPGRSGEAKGHNKSSFASVENGEEDEALCSNCGKSWKTRTSGLQSTAKERKGYNSAKRNPEAMEKMVEKYEAYLAGGGLPTDELNGMGMKLGAIQYSYAQLGEALTAYENIDPTVRAEIEAGTLSDASIQAEMDALNQAIIDANAGLLMDDPAYNDTVYEFDGTDFACSGSACDPNAVADLNAKADALDTYNEAIEGVETAQMNRDDVLDAQGLGPDPETDAVLGDVVDLLEVEDVVDRETDYEAAAAAAEEPSAIESALNEADEAIQGFLESVGE